MEKRPPDLVQRCRNHVGFYPQKCLAFAERSLSVLTAGDSEEYNGQTIRWICSCWIIIFQLMKIVVCFVTRCGTFWLAIGRNRVRCKGDRRATRSERSRTSL